MALDRGLISRDALMLGTAPALLRRGYFGGKTHPRRVLQQWSKRKTAPVGWQVIFAPKVLLAQPDDGSVALGPALIEHYVRTGDRERMFRDDRAIRAIRSLGEGELRGQVLAWVGRREGRAQESARDILLRALERAAHEDLRAARVLLEISLDRRDIDLATVVAAMAARVRILTIQGDLKSALQLGDWEFNDVPFEDRATLRRLQKVNAPGLAEWLHARARCALEDHNLDLTRMERRELTNLIERRRLGGQSRALLLDLDVRLSLARGETERALKHLEALAAIPDIDAPTILFAEAMLQAGRVLVARGLLDRVSVRRSLDSLDEVIQFTLVFGRVALAAGDIKAADDAVEGLPKRLESAMGEGSLSAAKVDQLRAEIAMARARYSQADMLAVRAEHVFRTRLDADHPTRIENELFRKIIPGHDPEPGALLALDRLSRVLGPAHPSVVQWRLRVGAAVARKARVERSSSN